jgi:cytochrome b6-f complex iron-sulfur subunit
MSPRHIAFGEKATGEAAGGAAFHEEKSMSEAEAQALPGVSSRVPLSRREFLYYLWGLSMALFMAEVGGALIWFALPRFRAGEFGGVFSVPIAEIPTPDADPDEFPAGRFWLVNLGEASIADPRQPQDYPVTAGVKAIYKVCTHLGCLYRWVPVNDRFECPCHGSKFLRSGTRIDGPARRNLDAFVIQAVDPSGTVVATSEQDPETSEVRSLQVPSSAITLRIDTGDRIRGGPNSKPGGGR